MELKLKYTLSEVEKLGEEFREAVIKAEEEYVMKKEAKREKVDRIKMKNAINQRKKLKMLSHRLIAAHFYLGNILDKSNINRAVETLERQANTIEVKSGGEC